MKKNGFTLIELLAVIVILAVIALITVPAVMNVVADAKVSAAKDAAYGYIKAVELDMAVKVGKGETVTLSTTLTTVTVDVKGTTPLDVNLVVTNGEVVSGSVLTSGYLVTVVAGEVTTAVASALTVLP